MSRTLAFIALAFVLAACSREVACGGDDSASSDSVSLSGGEQAFVPDNDIGMTVRSMAETINMGEPLDSAAYDFEGVLTDGIGAPLFTDMSGMPGQWEVDVLDSLSVRIRNLNAGDLQPLQLVEYLAANLEEGDAPLVLEAEGDRGDVHYVRYRYGRTSMHVETRPEPVAATGMVSPRMEIVLAADTARLKTDAPPKPEPRHAPHGF